MFLYVGAPAITFIHSGRWRHYDGQKFFVGLARKEKPADSTRSVRACKKEDRQYSERKYTVEPAWYADSFNLSFYRGLIDNAWAEIAFAFVRASESGSVDAPPHKKQY